MTHAETLELGRLIAKRDSLKADACAAWRQENPSKYRFFGHYFTSGFDLRMSGKTLVQRYVKGEYRAAFVDGWRAADSLVEEVTPTE